MAPFFLLFVAFVLASSHGALGAPSCSHGMTDTNSCVSKCKQKWGWPISRTMTMSVTPTPRPNSSPATRPTPTSIPPSSEHASFSTSGPASVSSAHIDAYLLAHNKVRAQFGANPLTWNTSLSSMAQGWADGCKFKHSVGAYGQNLAAGTGDLSIAAAIQLWANESSTYVPTNPQPSHFTQVVWKATTEVGCGVATCSSGTIFPASDGDGPASYYVCDYYPQGNILGMFSENVQ